MKILGLLCIVLVLTSCDSTRVYQPQTLGNGSSTRTGNGSGEVNITPPINIHNPDGSTGGTGSGGDGFYNPEDLGNGSSNPEVIGGGTGGGIEGINTNIENKSIVDQQDICYFATNSAKVQDRYKNSLNQLATIIKSDANYSIVIEGHCDQRGTEKHNLALSERRALEVKNYLVSQGVASSRITTIGYGESKPLKNGTSQKDYSFNRRAYFILQK